MPPLSRRNDLDLVTATHPRVANRRDRPTDRAGRLNLTCLYRSESLGALQASPCPQLPYSLPSWPGVALENKRQEQRLQG